MLQLANILRSMGFSITIAHTKFNFPDPSDHPDFAFLPISDDLSNRDISSMDFISMFSSLNSSCKSPLLRSVTQIMEKQVHDDELLCIIYDEFMYFAEAVAHELKLPSIILTTGSAASLLTYYSVPRLEKEGYIPFTDDRSLDLVPGNHPLRFRDLPISYFPNLDALLQLLASATDVRSATAIICNSIDCLEKDPLEQLQQLCNVPIFPIGPVHKTASTSTSSSTKEDRRCIEWLEKQTLNSVLYVSLGSIASMSNKDIKEMAEGLANSRQPFLWVLRPGSILPEDFNEIVKDRGYMVNWAPQKEVLAHEAVGGFWDHCGWNSTLESITEGIPMICQPYFGDQKANARYVTHVWRVGLEIENSLVSKEIKNSIIRLMVDDEGKEMRQRAINLKEKIILHTKENGSSYNSLRELTEHILSH
ncbi:hypothetical protein SLA2020_393130 [Shorea laevis]